MVRHERRSTPGTSYTRSLKISDFVEHKSLVVCNADELTVAQPKSFGVPIRPPQTVEQKVRPVAGERYRADKVLEHTHPGIAMNISDANFETGALYQRREYGGHLVLLDFGGFSIVAGSAGPLFAKRRRSRGMTAVATRRGCGIRD